MEPYDYSDWTLQLAFGNLVQILKRGTNKSPLHPLEQRYLLELAGILGQQELICAAVERGPLGAIPEGVGMEAMFLYPRLKDFFAREGGSLRDVSRLVVEFSKGGRVRKDDRKALLALAEKLESEFAMYSMYDDSEKSFPFLS